MYQPQRRCRQFGFTLIEIMVVVMILAIVAAVVIPQAVGTKDLQVMSAARMFATDLQYAQDTAITSQVPITVTIDTNAESYALSNASGNLEHPITKYEYVVDFMAQKGFESMDIVSVDFGGGNTIVFDEMGSPDNAGTITLRAGSHVYRVTVAVATGKVTVIASGS